MHVCALFFPSLNFRPGDGFGISLTRLVAASLARAFRGIAKVRPRSVHVTVKMNFDGSLQCKSVSSHDTEKYQTGSGVYHRASTLFGRTTPKKATVNRPRRQRQRYDASDNLSFRVSTGDRRRGVSIQAYRFLLVRRKSSRLASAGKRSYEVSA